MSPRGWLSVWDYEVWPWEHTRYSLRKNVSDCLVTRWRRPCASLSWLTWRPWHKWHFRDKSAGWKENSPLLVAGEIQYWSVTFSIKPFISSKNKSHILLKFYPETVNENIFLDHLNRYSLLKEKEAKIRQRYWRYSKRTSQASGSYTFLWSWERSSVHG